MTPRDSSSGDDVRPRRNRVADRNAARAGVTSRGNHVPDTALPPGDVQRSLPWSAHPDFDSPGSDENASASAVPDTRFLQRAGVRADSTSAAPDVSGLGVTHPKVRSTLRAAINHLENLSPIALREPAMVGAYLALIFALPDRVLVNVALGERVLSRIDERFLQMLDALQSPDVPPAKVSQARSRTTQIGIYQASILSAYLFMAACPSVAFSAAGTFEIAAWQQFIASFWRRLSEGVPEVDVEAVRELRPIDIQASFARNVGLWAAEPGHADENRAEAALLIQICNDEGHTTLDLSYLGLRSLPAALWLLDRPGSACMAAGGLRNLRLNDNCLKNLPEAIGQLKHLQKLSISRNHLLSLPSTLGELTALTSLQLSDNEISALPSSIGKLTALRSLLADGCLLTSIPDEMVTLAHLGEIDLDDNLLTSLPSGLARLPDTCIVRLFDNPLSPRVKHALTHISDGPVCLVSDAASDAESHAESVAQADAASVSAQAADLRVHRPRGLTDAAFDWLDLSAHRTSDARKRWRALEAMPNASSLALVLDGLAKLAEATNWNTRIAFRQRVTALLLSIVARPALGRVCLGLARDALAHDALVKCDTARACLVRLEALVADDQAQHLGLSLHDILRLSLRRFRLNMIDRVVRDQLVRWPFTDESDLRLAYWHALSNHIDLGLQFFDAEHAREGSIDGASRGTLPSASADANTHADSRSDARSSARSSARSGTRASAPALLTTLSVIPHYNIGPVRLSAADVSAAVATLAAAEEEDAVVSFLIDYAPWRAGICRQEHAHFESLLAQFDLEDDAMAENKTASALTSTDDDKIIASKRRMKEAQAARFSAQLIILTTAWLRA